MLSQLSAAKSGAGGPRGALRRGEAGSKSAAELAGAKAQILASQQPDPPIQRSLIEYIQAVGRDKRGGFKQI